MKIRLSGVIVIFLIISLLLITGCAGGVKEQTKLVFEWGNSLYTVNIDGTNMKQIPHDMDIVDYCPVWSPDGSKIAFLSYKSDPKSRDINFYIINSDGTNRIECNIPKSDPQAQYKAFHSFPIWSPKGDKLLFSFNQYIYIINSDGTNLTKLTAEPIEAGDVQLPPSWSPDGSKILFQSPTKTSPLTNIYIMNSDGSGLTQLTQSGYTAGQPLPSTFTRDSNPVWSPDGTKVAFLSSLINRTEDNKSTINYRLSIMGTDGKNRVDIPGNDNLSYYYWSPDSSKLAFWSIKGGITNLYSVKTDGTGLVNITNFTEDMWKSFNKSTGDPVQDAGQTAMTLYIYSRLAMPQWSPDSSQILLVLPLSKDRWDVAVIQSDGSKITKLTDKGINASAMWAKDGSKIVFCSMPDPADKNVVNFVVMNKDGSQRQSLTDGLERIKDAESFAGLLSVFPYSTLKVNPGVHGW